MDTRQLTAFVVVAELGSFTGAASELCCSQPTVTARIKALEEDLGVRLFQRLPRGVRTTRAGEALRGYAHRIMLLNDNARRAVASEIEKAGTVFVGATESVTTYRLLPLIEYLSLRFPDIQISVRSLAYDEIKTAVREGRADCAFFMDFPPDPEDLGSKVLCQEPLALVAGSENPLVIREPVEIDDLRKATLICSDRTAPYHREFERLFEVGGWRPTVIELDSVDATKRGVAGGLGVALMPEVVVTAELTAASLRRLAWTPPFTLHTGMMWCPESTINPVVNTLLSAASKVVDEQVGRG